MGTLVSVYGEGRTMVLVKAYSAGYRFEEDSAGSVSVYGPSGYLLDKFYMPPRCNLEGFMTRFWSVAYDLGKFKVNR